MARFFTSDLHLGHGSIIDFCSRPYDSVNEMNEDLVRRWNDTVAPDDEVTIVGDLAMGYLRDSLFFVGEMNGHKYLVPGNHDRMFRCLNSRRAHMEELYLEAGIERVLDEEFTVEIGEVTYLVSHFPYRGESVEDREDRYKVHRPIDRGMRLIHGHTHGKWRKSGRMVDVGVDAWGGYPVTYETAVGVFLSAEDRLSPLRW